MSNIIYLNDMKANHRRPEAGAMRQDDTPRQPNDDMKSEEQQEGHRILRQLGNSRKLSESDRVRLAKNLHRYIKQCDLKTRDLVREAGLGQDGAKEIYRLTLPPDADPKTRSLRALSRNYHQLIKGIHRLTGENLELLAEKMAYGTSLHPKGVKNLSRVEKALVLLQGWADAVDEEYGLLELYRTTAQARIELLNRGGRLRWPSLRPLDKFDRPKPADLELCNVYWPDYDSYFDTESPFYDLHEASHIWHRQSRIYWHEVIPYVPHLFIGFQSTAVYISAVDDACYFPCSPAFYAHFIDPTRPSDSPYNPIWMEKVNRWMIDAIGRMSMRIDWDVSGSSGPRPVLTGGQGLESIEKTMHRARTALFADVYEALLAMGLEITDELIERASRELRKFVIYGDVVREFLKLRSAYQERAGQSVTLTKRLSDCLGYTMPHDPLYGAYDRHIPAMRWLILYPNESCNRIIPVMAETPVDTDDDADIGAISLKPLESARDLDEYGDEEYECFGEPGEDGRLPTVWDRIVEIVAKQEVLAEWRRTAPFLHHNPILRQKARDDKKNKAINSTLEAMLRERFGKPTE